MKDNYPAALAAVLKHEGGFANHPRDPGGATMKGVTQRVYDAFRRNRGLTARSVRDIADDELQAIYRRQYWDAAACDDLPSGVDYAVFDFAVNSGVSRAANYLQTVLGVGVDGVIGNVTIRAAHERPAASIINALMDNRLRFLKRLETWDTFGKGWDARVTGVRKMALALAAKPATRPAEPSSQPPSPTPPLPMPPKPPAPAGEAPSGFWAMLISFIAALFNRKGTKP